MVCLRAVLRDGQPGLPQTCCWAGAALLLTASTSGRWAKETSLGLAGLAMGGRTCSSLCPGLLQLTGGVSKGLAVLTLDQDYIARFRDRPMSYQQRLLSGLQALMLGLYEGVVGEPQDDI